MTAISNDNLQYKEITGRQITALLNPRPAVLVTCCDENGVPNAISIAWHTPLSHDPPLVGISVGKTRYSYKLIEQSGEFVINIVDTSFRNAVETCGNVSGADCNKIELAGLELRPTLKVRSPFILGSLGYLACQLEQQIPVGDHTLFVGRVLSAMVQAKRFSDSWMPDKAKVLLFWYRRRYGFGVYEEGTTPT